MNICGNLFHIFAICLALLSWCHIEARPQDLFGTIGLGVAQIAAQAGDIISNGGALRDDRGFELPFAKVHSKSEAGIGEAMIQRHNSDSSEEDRRRKRSLDIAYNDVMAPESLLEMESMWPQPHYHRSKRTPCLHGTGGTGGGTETGGAAADDTDVDVVERRKKMAAKRRAKQKSKSRNSKRNKTKKLIGDDSDGGDGGVEDIVSRRKRQSEVDDLNANMNSAGKDISEHAKQFAEKVRGLWQNLVNSMTEMAERVKQAFKGGGGDQTTGDV